MVDNVLLPLGCFICKELTPDRVDEGKQDGEGERKGSKVRHSPVSGEAIV